MQTMSAPSTSLSDARIGARLGDGGDGGDDGGGGGSGGEQPRGRRQQWRQRPAAAAPAPTGVALSEG